MSPKFLHQEEDSGGICHRVCVLIFEFVCELEEMCVGGKYENNAKMENMLYIFSATITFPNQEVIVVFRCVMCTILVSSQIARRTQLLH